MNVSAGGGGAAWGGGLHLDHPCHPDAAAALFLLRVPSSSMSTSPPVASSSSSSSAAAAARARLCEIQLGHDHPGPLHARARKVSSWRVWVQLRALATRSIKTLRNAAAQLVAVQGSDLSAAVPAELHAVHETGVVRVLLP